MFSKTFIRATVVALCSIPALAMAQSALKIGVVNIGQLLQESPQAVAANERLNDEFAPRQRELMALQTEYEEKAAALQKNVEVMGAEERDNAQRDLRNDERAFVRAQNEFREDLDLRRNEVIAAVQRDVLIEINAFGEAEGFDLILVDGIVYASDKVDVTARVLERLQANTGAGQ